jgi:hypothetical protein
VEYVQYELLPSYLKDHIYRINDHFYILITHFWSYIYMYSLEYKSTRCLVTYRKGAE